MLIDVGIGDDGVVDDCGWFVDVGIEFVEDLEVGWDVEFGIVWYVLVWNCLCDCVGGECC